MLNRQIRFGSSINNLNAVTASEQQLRRCPLLMADGIKIMMHMTKGMPLCRMFLNRIPAMKSVRQQDKVKRIVGCIPIMLLMAKDAVQLPSARSDKLTHKPHVIYCRENAFLPGRSL